MKSDFKISWLFWGLIICGLGSFFLVRVFSHAATVDELQQKIQSKQEDIKKLNAEIAQYRNQLNQVGAEKSSLNKEINRLELSRKKLQADIAMTQNKISLASLKIQDLSQGIKTTAEKISDNQEALSETLRQINDREQTGLAENLVGGETLAELWDNLNRYENLNSQINNLLNTLRQDKKQLEGDKQKKEIEKKQLANFASQLTDQKKITEQTKQEKDTLLAVTKNKETTYQQLLADRLKKKEEVENELLKAENELKYTLNPKSLPSAGRGVLTWPLDHIKITQGFGNTDFAKTHYDGKGHRGIDLAAAIGDPVYAAASGVVMGTGDTDLTCRGASYGRWILIKHNNGLATIYAHLSAVKVSEGQQVDTRQLIAYSGNTGYSTGPHLHLTVIAADGVNIGTLKSKVPGCGIYRIPIIPTGAYLNPLNYL